MIKKVSKNVVRQRRHLRVRKHIIGTSARPRLNVFRSASNIYAQIIDDSVGNTLVAASSLDKAVKEKIEFGGNIDAAAEVGKLVAERALANGIKTVVTKTMSIPLTRSILSYSISGKMSCSLIPIA